MDKTIKNQIDNIWLKFFEAGLSTPTTVIEQISYLLFLKNLDEVETNKECTSELLGIKYENKIFDDEHQDCRWSNLKHMSANEMYRIYTEKAFPFIKNLHLGKETSFSKYMANAVVLIPTLCF